MGNDIELLPAKLQSAVIDFLMSHPSIHDSDGQRALVYNAALDQQLLTQIPFGKPSGQFVPLLVSALIHYQGFSFT